MDTITKSKNFANFRIQKSGEDKILIQIPTEKGLWKKEYNENDQIEQLLKDFKDDNQIDVPTKFFDNFKRNKSSINITDKLKVLLDEVHFSINPGYLQDLYLVGKPFNNPFEIFVFDRLSKILNIQMFDKREEEINSLGLNNYGPSSAYCNGNNHLYISGGETDDNQIIDKFYDIDLTNNQIEGPYQMYPKKNHSMIFIPPDKVFIVGGNDTKTFYFDLNKKKIIDQKDLNITRTEPALEVMGNILYCFDNVNKANNEKISFEKLNLDNPEAEWEMIYPEINEEKFPQKFFAVSKDKTGENIIFLGGNMDESNDITDLKNYKYNPESNSIEQTNIPFRDFNYKEKTFLPYNKNVDYLLPDFNRQHPEVTFFVKNKSRFEKVNYLPKQELNENNNYILTTKKYSNSKYYNFNMPGIKIDLGNTNNLLEIKEPSYNQIDSEKDDVRKISIEPPFEAPEINPIKVDNQIDIKIPDPLEEYNTKINQNKNNLYEEEKNSENNLELLEMKLRYNGKPST